MINENDSESIHKEISIGNNHIFQRKQISIIDFAGNLDDLSHVSIEDKIKNFKTSDNFRQVDILERRSKSILKTIAYYMNTTNPLEWIFILFFSIVLTIICYLLDLSLAWGITLRHTICSTESQFLNLVVWVSSSVGLLLIATSVGYFISADADGSGIPEIKTVLSGISIYRYFSVETFIAKVIGLYSALVGGKFNFKSYLGASIGKVGPYVHFAAIVCSRLMKIKFFSKINSSSSTKTAMLSASTAAGITLALGTPLGAVIFSMEVTSSIYLVGNLTKAIATTTICILFSKILNATAQNIDLFLPPEHLTPLNDTVIIFDIIFFVFLGIVCGLIGALLAIFVSKLVYIRRKSKLKLLNNRFLYATITALIISIITFIVKPLMIFDRHMLGNIFNKNFPKDLDELNHPNEGVSLLVLFSFKFLITVLTLAMNIPAGIFAPFFLIGAYFGRFYGHFFKMFFNLSEESIYAMVGAASVMSGATHSISSAIIVFELTGQASYLIPMLISCLIANLTAQAFSISFFDVFLLMKNLPHLPSIKSTALYRLTSERIMSKEIYPILIDHFNYINSLEILYKIPSRYSRTVPIPIIDNSGIVKYTIRAKKLFKLLFTIFENYKLNYEYEIIDKMQRIIFHIQKKFGKKYKSFGEYLKKKIKKIFISKNEKDSDKLNKSNEDINIGNLLIFLKDYTVTTNDGLILGAKIDVNEIMLNSDKSAFTIDKNYPCLKLHFLFTFLSVSHIFIYDNGCLSGVITKEDFVRKSMLVDD